MSNRKRWTVVTGLLLVIGLGWWFYPREVPRIWWNGTAPNPKGLLAVRPTIALPLNEVYQPIVNLVVNGKTLTDTEITLARNQKVIVSGDLHFRNIPSGAFLLDVQVAFASRSSNYTGMISESKLSLNLKETFDKKEYENGERRASFNQEWVIPDHEGEFLLYLAFFVAIPGDRHAPQNFALVCPAKIK